MIIFCHREVHHGTQIFQESVRQGWTRDEEAQVRYLKERPFRPEGKEPQAGDCDRPFRSEICRRQSAKEGLEKAQDGQEGQEEDSQETEGGLSHYSKRSDPTSIVEVGSLRLLPALNSPS
jgi:hypothetical protein